MDKEVFIDFHANKPLEADREEVHHSWQNLKKFLRTQSNLFLNINFDKEGADPLSPFIHILKSFNYAGNKISFDQNKFRFKNKVGFQHNFTNSDNLFFINGSEDGQLNKWKVNNGFCIACSEELMDTWRKLSLAYGLPKSLPVRDFDTLNNFTSWNGLVPYQHPVTDITISDRFFLTSKDLVEANFIPLLKSLISNTLAHFHLTLFTSKSYVFEKDIHVMKSYLDEELKLAKFNCTLLLVYDTVEQFKEHDRHIITNYYHLSAGDSFTFFEKDGGLKTNGTTLDIKPLVDADYFNVACSVLKNLKRSFEHVNIEKTEGKLSRIFSLALD